MPHGLHAGVYSQVEYDHHRGGTRVIVALRGNVAYPNPCCALPVKLRGGRSPSRSLHVLLRSTVTGSGEEEHHTVVVSASRARRCDQFGRRNRRRGARRLCRARTRCIVSRHQSVSPGRMQSWIFNTDATAGTVCVARCALPTTSARLRSEHSQGTCGAAVGAWLMHPQSLAPCGHLYVERRVTPDGTYWS